MSIFDQWNAALRERCLGPHALVEDNSRRARATTLLNLRAVWTPTALERANVEFYGERLNALNSRRSDVEYWYASRLSGEPPAGVEGVHSRIVEPRTMRGGVRGRF